MAATPSILATVLERLISGDPVEVAVTREESVDDGAGGLIDKTTDVGTRAIRMTPATRGTASTRTYPEAGGIVFDEWLAYDTPDTPITTGAQTKDTLTDPRGNRYRVESRQELTYGGEVIGVRFRLSKES